MRFPRDRPVPRRVHVVQLPATHRRPADPPRRREQEEEKAQFSAATELDSTQISNWFINQRKRHWHKFFWDGLPQSEREARAHIKKHNLLAQLHKSSA